MKVILMFNSDDERRMKQGELMMLPGGGELYATFEPRKKYIPRATARIETAKPRLITDKRWECQYCGRQCKAAPGKFAHEQACAKRHGKREVKHA